MRWRVFVFAVVVLAVSLAFSMPQTITYQGKLTDTDGVALNGSYDLTFVIYDSVSVGDSLWGENHAAVPVDHGLFRVILGVTFPLDIPFDEAYWLEIRIGGTPLSPRMEFTANPYAFRAIIADSVIGGSGADNDWTVDGDNMYAIPTGNIGVGTISPSAQLHLQDASGNALHIQDAGLSGIYIQSPGLVGIEISSPADDGIRIEGGINGIDIVGNATTARGIHIHPLAASGDPDTGIVVQYVADHGIVIRETGGCGLYIHSNNYAAGNYGLYSGSATSADTVGYFHGNVHITGDMTVDGTYPGSSGVGDLAHTIDAGDEAGNGIGNESINMNRVDCQLRYTHLSDAYLIHVENSTNMGIHWDEGYNYWQWYGGGIERGRIDLDNGNMQIDGTFNIYNYLFNSSTTNFSGAVGVMDDLVPASDGTYDLGTSSLEWEDLRIDGTAYLDRLYMHGNIEMYNNCIQNTGSSYGGGAAFCDDVTPTTDDTYDLGTSSYQWSNLYVDGTAYIDHISMGGTIDMYNNCIQNTGSSYGNSVAFCDDIVPSTDATYDLGTSSIEWYNLYLDGTAYIDVLNMTGGYIYNSGSTYDGGVPINDDIVPTTDDTYDIGTSSYEWDNLYIDGIAYIDVLNMTGSGNYIYNSSSYCDGGVPFNDAIVPYTDDTHDIGTTTYEWSDLYIDGIAYIDRLNIDDTNGYIYNSNASSHGGAVPFYDDIIPHLNAGSNLGADSYAWNDLYLDGKIYVDGSATTNKYLGSDGSGNLAWKDAGNVSGSGATDKIAYWNHSDTLTYDDDLHWNSVGNRLGIGTDSPTSKLTIVGTGTPGSIDTNTLLHLKNSEYAAISIEGGSSGASFIDFNDELGIAPGKIIYNHSSNALYFSANSAEHLRIDSTGNVGIGTTTPAYKLEVNGNAHITGHISTDNSTKVENFNSEMVGGIYAGHFICNADYDTLVNCSSVLLIQNGARNLFRIYSNCVDASGCYAYYHDGVQISCGMMLSGANYDFDISPDFNPHHDEVILSRPWGGGATARIDIYYENSRCGGIWFSTDPLSGW